MLNLTGNKARVGLEGFTRVIDWLQPCSLAQTYESSNQEADHEF